MFSVTIFLAAAALIVVAAVMGIVSMRRPDRSVRARALVWTAAAIMTVFTVLAGLFISGYALADPGGTEGIMLVLWWAVPLAVLAVLAWLRPSWAAPVLALLTALVVMAGIWFALDSASWREFENANGPVRAVAVLVLAFPAAVLGLKRTATAGWLLLALGLGPIAFSALGNLAGVVSLSAVSVIPLITGLLFLLAARMTRASVSTEHMGALPA
ncbi:hypothetical protein TV39_05930 [Arthrobacter sp. SPG23]|uniref:hypothetical protein n=1 Tax=Arthrobacter sp. SPG23 TaxID=1610703 RepID=UPI0005B8BA37|nr:hypothetical protein [Arthrobacter sp. SPG23]KIS28328.1 hypothetical protein TV39_05930 [Arthrobacter sp. SPG23]